MKYIAYLIAILAILVLAFGVLGPLGLGLVTPSLLLLVVICLSLEFGSLDFFFFALVGGLWMDLYFSLPFGSFMGAYVIAGLAGYILFQRLLLTEMNWKYYVIFVIAAELVLLGWLWAYTHVLFLFHWSTIALSGREIIHYSVIMLLAALVSAFPVYLIITLVASKAKQLLRQPLQL